ncbi:hypothetical protein MM300_13955 [Evansella sp. LMS18]|uniref:DUF6944 family repetitive protein n=1 Tax=Evansella sp. LMS18 TaxID=2924033 RepID=UPI0020D01417|nr:hypothetical protein [Evansella sp. LMS18]UTR09027.1 hypothetical protein MM300_13955 [Evansella sp. LMS18]
MPEELIDVIGNWIENFGATLGAIGETRLIAGEDDFAHILVILGNGNQSLGNVIQGLVEREDVNAWLGNWLQAGGNASISATEYELLKGRLDETTGIYNKIYGDVTQSVGAFLAALGRLDDQPKRVIGNVIQSLGAALGAIGSLYVLNNEELKGQQLQAVGGWLQSIGTALQAIGATRRYLYGEGVDDEVETEQGEENND